MFIKEKLDNIFQFLKQHHQWNEDLQSAEYRRMLTAYPSPKDKLTSLLYATANSQSKPRLDHLAEFWKTVHGSDTLERDLTIEKLVKLLEPNSGMQGPPLETIFRALVRQSGWGEKTAALFVKNVVNIHRSRDTTLHFFDGCGDAMRNINDDKIYLPVDAVIKHIFSTHIWDHKGDFKLINRELQERFNSEDMLIWDDLWFWGFITQIIENNKRLTKWNDAKYWCNHHADKASIDEVKGLAQKFIRILDVR